MKNFDTVAVLLILFVAIVLLTTMPFVQIWAVNSLFDLHIKYSWFNWFCVLILNASLKNVPLERKK